jgi:flagellar basal-body rod protein FlgC
MSLNNIFQISSQGMSVQRERLEAAASNLANSNTTRTVAGGPYRRRDVVVESVSISEAEAANAQPFASSLSRAFGEKDAESVRAKTLVAETGEGVKRYQPEHPDADAKGYVTMPDVDPLEETVNMLSAARAFEANATAFNTAKEMARASLRLGDA